MSTGLKMAASAVVAAALTAALFLTLGNNPAPPAAPPVQEPADDGPVDLDPPIGVGSGGVSATSTALAVPRDIPELRGDGEVRGRVATAEGDGVAGVVIIATPHPESPGSWVAAAPPPPDLEEEIQKAVAATHRRVNGTRRATTTSDGSYVLSGLGDLRYSLRAYREGYELRAAQGHDAWGAKPGAEVDFVAKAVVGVRVLVEGGRVSGPIRILCAADEEGLKRAGGMWWSADRPVLSMAPGTWWLQAYQDPDRERVSEPRQVTLEAGAPAPTVVLRLQERTGLRGTIVVTDDLDVQRLDVYALRFSGDEPPPVGGLHRNRGELRGRTDNRTGRYSFPDIGPGRYLVWVTFGQNRVMGSAVVEVLDRMVEQEIEVGIDDPDRYVVVRVFGPDGQPLDARSTQFSTTYRGPTISSSGGAEAIHRKDGSWFVGADPRMPAMADHPGGEFRIKVTHRAFGSQEVVCDPAMQRELTFRFGGVASLTVSIPGLAKSGLGDTAGLYLKKRLEENGISLSGSPARAGDGVFVIDKVQPGDWILVLVSGDQGELIMVDRLAVTVVEGENPIDWALGPLHEVRLEPADASKPVRFGLKRIDPAGNWMHQFARNPGEGAAVFRFVPPGRYELTGNYAGEKRSIQIDVPAQTHVRLE